MIATDPQTQSNFITRLPYDIRAAIYKELWPSWTPRQHVVWHIDPNADETKSHLHREPCISRFQLHDELQTEIEALRQEKQVPLGEPLNDPAYRQRLESCWMNHWKCGERLDEELGEERNFFYNTSIGGCWCDKKPKGDRDTYLPMLLSCKFISEECLRFLYSTTTFVFTDMLALQSFVGHCQPPHPSTPYKLIKPVIPQAFRKYALHFEVSLFLDFQLHLMCSVLDEDWTDYNEMFKFLHGEDALEPVHSTDPHNPFDFHWLHLESFENLRSVKIWVSGRREGGMFSAVRLGVPINKVGVDALTKSLSAVKTSSVIVLSTHLDDDIEPEDGYVQGTVDSSGAQIWRRGAGDRFHPGRRLTVALSDGPIETSETRVLHLD
ncbi:hypothetical protein CDV36_000884 [Fusarium kuroshium]|uniref:Uncharacterized protein n=1 Tax=Fusarium kuroshium TaxID=2010991 RepID=A0A3M2SQN3_9HYPO|nr:hypothetical protein CDV36_000884 [Fusarium kuroshium]